MKAMNIAIYTLTSELHNEQAVSTATQEFLRSLGVDYELKGCNYADYGTHALDLIYVRTGGTEGIFRQEQLAGGLDGDSVVPQTATDTWRNNSWQ